MSILDGVGRGSVAPVLGALAAAAVVTGLGLCLSGPAVRAEPASAESPPAVGAGLFATYCMACHGNPLAPDAPPPQTLRAMSAEHLHSSLSHGMMRSIGDQLTEVQKRQVAEAASGRRLGSRMPGSADAMPNRCPTHPRLSPGSADWNGWGLDLGNTRFQPAAGLGPEQLKRLRLRWAFGLPGSTSAYSQPAVVGGRVFLGSDTGFVYSLDARTGCVHWSFFAQAAVRNAVVIAPVKRRPGVRYGAYFGDLRGNVYAVDAETGEPLWSTLADGHPSSRITASPAVWRGRVFVPVSSWESSSARREDYSCCTFQGSVVALDGATGRTLWRRVAIDQRPGPAGVNARGLQLFAPAGAAVWNTPTIDPVRHALYFGTGGAYTYPAPATTDAVMAVRIADGQVLWTRQIHAGDSSLTGCWDQGVTSNCPKVQGPNWDLPASPILRTLEGGRRVLVIATKQGDVLALDPDRKGAQVWRMNVNGDLAGPGGPDAGRAQAKGMLFGGAADRDAAYFSLQGSGGGLAAVRLRDGKLLWLDPLDWKADQPVVYPAAATAVPGAILVAGADGKLIAAAAADGARLWAFDTARTFATVNGAPAHGGSFGSAGAVVAEGMVFAGSGYGVSSTKPGNVLLAFSPDQNP